MDKKTFAEHYALSRGQLDRLVEKAWKNQGIFSIAGFGSFKVSRSGPGKKDPLDIVPVKPADVPETKPEPIAVAAAAASAESFSSRNDESPIPSGRDLRRLNKAELERIKDIAMIEKTRQACESERQKIRSEVLAELTSTVSMAFSQLRWTIDELRLPDDQLERLRAALEKSLDRLGGVRLK